MRILSIIASLAESGGTEMLTRNLSLDYARRGHACHIAYISDARSLGASLDFERGFMAELDRAGIGHERIGHDCRRNVVLGAWRLRRIVRRFRPDVLHVHLGYALLFQAIGLLRVPTVYTHHNVVFRFAPSLFRVFDRFVDRYVAISPACERVLSAHVGGPIQLIPNGVPRAFATVRKREPAADDVEILSVGNLTPQKDYPTLIAAAAKIVPLLAARGRVVRFRIAGEGPERPALERAIARVGLERNIALLGARGDVAELMASADLLVLASRYEGLPISLIEAAMSGLPVVATDVGGSGDVVIDGLTGVLVPPGSPAHIAEAVIGLLSDPGQYAACSAAARERGGKFTLEACADAHLQLYSDIIASRNASAVSRASPEVS